MNCTLKRFIRPSWFQNVQKLGVLHKCFWNLHSVTLWPKLRFLPANYKIFTIMTSSNKGKNEKSKDSYSVVTILRFRYWHYMKVHSFFSWQKKLFTDGTFFAFCQMYSFLPSKSDFLLPYSNCVITFTPKNIGSWIEALSCVRNSVLIKDGQHNLPIWLFCISRNFHFSGNQNKCYLLHFMFLRSLLKKCILVGACITLCENYRI